ncbi:hypothetical protein [Streptomyces indiaensis]|uniref:Uncharacterized protein n=1 Tax=Streptomyces indiaensis TaxID=284033 RepID=A0ABN3EEV5_9ACTN|nr:hypothetical protein [Streptomyces indiaensis]MCF1644674.1 hypothetical protein [Streptomyces indiaensis]
MTDMTRPSGGQTPETPDARGESALGTGRHVPPGTDADRAAAHGTDVPGTDRRADRPDIDRHDAERRLTDPYDTDRHDTDRHLTDRHDTDRLGSGAPRGDHGTGSDKAGSAKHRAHLLADKECDKLGGQLQHAVAGFVDGPRTAVEEADHVLEEIAARFTEAVTQRRRTLRHSWQSVEGGESRAVSSADTEQLRLALKDYRELAERLLHV